MEVGLSWKRRVVGVFGGVVKGRDVVRRKGRCCHPNPPSEGSNGLSIGSLTLNQTLQMHLLGVILPLHSGSNRQMTLANTGVQFKRVLIFFLWRQAVCEERRLSIPTYSIGEPHRPCICNLFYYTSHDGLYKNGELHTSLNVVADLLNIMSCF